MAAETHGLQISRRQFVQGASVAGLGLLAGCGPWPGQARPRVPSVGWLSTYPRPTWYDAFRQGLREAGLIEGENLILHTRAADGQALQLQALATELVGLPVDVLVIPTSDDVATARRADHAVPIVFGISSDPVGQGLVASFARPGGNTTGLSVMNTALSGKRLELLAGSVPNLTRVGVLLYRDRGAQIDLDETQSAARVIAIETLVLHAQSPEDLESQFQAANRQRAGAMIVLPGSSSQAAQIAVLAAQYRLPTMYPQRDFVEAGGLMSYGPNFLDSFRRAAYYVDRILKGAKPADLPVEQPREFEFIITLKTAQALSLTIPQHILLQATEVIQ